MPKNKYNIDQVPVPFVNKQDKQQATLQLCIRADGQQNVKPPLIFRGKGHMATEEKEKYDKRVDVYFQQNAWMDEDINMQWVQGTRIPGIGNDKGHKVLFCFQQSKTFHETYRNNINTTVYMLPENHTDKIQPIDAGCGPMMKGEIGAAMEIWLEEEINDKRQDRLSAKDRRILMTQWTGEAWSDFSNDEIFFQEIV